MAIPLNCIQSSSLDRLIYDSRFFSHKKMCEYLSVHFSISRHRKVVKESLVNLVRCDGRPVWSRTSDCQSGNPGSNPGRRMSTVNSCS